MVLSLAHGLLGEIGHGSLAVMKSSTTILGLEVVSRVVDSLYHKYNGVLPRPDKTGFARFAFKLLRPFSGVETNDYKFPTSLLVVSAIGMGALTFLGNQLITPYHIPCGSPDAFSHILLKN